MPHGSDSPTVQHPDRPGVCQPLGTGAGTRLARGRAEAPEPRPGDAPAPASAHAAGPPLRWEEPPSARGTQSNSENTLPHPRKVGAARPLPAGRAECSPPRGGPRGWVPLRRSSGAHGGARCYPCGGGVPPPPDGLLGPHGALRERQCPGTRRLSKRIKGGRRPLSARAKACPAPGTHPSSKVSSLHPYHAGGRAACPRGTSCVREPRGSALRGAQGPRRPRGLHRQPAWLPPTLPHRPLRAASAGERPFRPRRRRRQCLEHDRRESTRRRGSRVPWQPRSLPGAGWAGSRQPFLRWPPGRLSLTSKVFPVTSNSGGTKAPSGSSGEEERALVKACGARRGVDTPAPAPQGADPPPAPAP